MAAESFPAGMAVADHAAEVDADLDEVDEEGFFFFGCEIGAEQECGVGRRRGRYSRPYAGMFSTGCSKPKKQVPTQGAG